MGLSNLFEINKEKVLSTFVLFVLSAVFSVYSLGVLHLSPVAWFFYVWVSPIHYLLIYGQIPGISSVMAYAPIPVISYLVFTLMWDYLIVCLIFRLLKR